MIMPYATILDKASKPSLSEILHSDNMKPWDRYEMDNIKVIPLGSSAASICYEVEASRGKQVYEAMYALAAMRYDDVLILVKGFRASGDGQKIRGKCAFISKRQ